jgi:hypothetical protein
MSNRIEQSTNGEIALFACRYVFNAEVVEEVAVALTFGCDGVPEDGLCKRVSCSKVWVWV